MTALTTFSDVRTQSSKTAMDGLYQRLQQAGFNRAFVQHYLLPAWWDDTLGDNPTMRAIAEIGIARMIGASIQALRASDMPLQLLPNYEFRLKRNKGVAIPELLPALALAQSIAHILAETLADLPPFVAARRPLRCARKF